MSVDTNAGLTFRDFMDAVCWFVGWGRNYTVRSKDEQDQLSEIVNDGAQQVYGAYDWSWLRPVETLTTSLNQWEYILGTGVVGIEGELTYAVDDGYYTVPVVPEGRIRQMRQSTSRAGRPQFVALRPRAGITGASGQRLELITYPTPDTEYELTYRAIIVATQMDSEQLFPLGGAIHSRLIKASCIAVAEETFHDVPSGPKMARYMRLLQDAIRQDRVATAPEYYGYNGDPGTRRYMDVRTKDITYDPMTPK